VERKDLAVHLLSHKRSEALPGPQSPLGCQPFDCYLSIQLVEVGPTITHHPGPGLCLIWLCFLDCCQLKLADMFRLLSEKSKSRLFWRGRVHCSTAWQDCASALVCPLVDVDSQSSCRQRILPQWWMMASFCHDVIWIWDYLSSYFNYISTIGLRIWSKYLSDLWSCWFYQVQRSFGKPWKCFLFFSPPPFFLSDSIYVLCPASAVRCIWSMKATHHCDV